MALSHAEVNARYRANHPERVAAHNATYAAAHREERLAYLVAYRAENRDEIAAKRAAKYAVNRESELAVALDYYQANRDERLAYQLAYSHQDHAVIQARARQLRFHYGITNDQYDAMLEVQGGLCAICRQPETKVMRGKVLRLAVDHDHATDVVRGLLCNDCNQGVGRFHDRPDTLAAAVAYLQKGSL